MEKLHTYLSNLPVQERKDLAQRCGTSANYLRNLSYGQRQISPKLASIVERETNGALTRKDFFPDDWCIIWPELS